jgi:hypothetical protein
VIRTATAPIVTTVATTAQPDPTAAAAALVAQLGTEDALYALFVTADYPRAELAAALAPFWDERVIGCTSAGNIGTAGFSTDPVLAIAFRGGGLTAHTIVIEPLSDRSTALQRARAELALLPPTGAGVESFGMLLVDGLSMAEEHVAAALTLALGDIPLIGGSAGDDLTFRQTAVLAGGEFRSDRATLTVVSTRAPFQVFRMQHYEPQETVLVITAASPGRRLVHEINGGPAAPAYAEAIGVPVAELGPQHFIANPVLLRAAGENWVRGISAALPDGSLQFNAAISTGAALRLGRPGDAEELLRRRFGGIRDDLGGRITGLLAFDCIGRRVELAQAGLDAAIGQVFAEYRTVGFSTYGEQFNDLHMNQTMVGVAFGGTEVV